MPLSLLPLPLSLSLSLPPSPLSLSLSHTHTHRVHVSAYVQPTVEEKSPLRLALEIRKISGVVSSQRSLCRVAGVVRWL